jgi:hypothetical protein
MEIDLTQEPKPLYFDLGADFDFFINLNILDKMGFGIFSGLETLGQFSLSEDIQKFLLGNELGKTYTGDIGTGGAVFMEAGANGYFYIKEFRVSVRPAYFFPVAYMKPNGHYKIYTSNDGTGSASMNFEYDLALYTSLASINNLDDLNLNNFDISSGRGGVDLAAAVEYPLLPGLTLGATVTHIPIFPAELTNYTSIKGGKELKSDDLLNELINGGDLGDLLKDKEITSSHGSLMIFRPFKFGVNAVYTPFKNSTFSFSVIPQIGYAYNEIYVEPHSFEAVVKARLGLLNMMRSNPLFIFTVGTGYEDRLWKHGFDFTMNLRAFQWDVGIAVQSEDFVKSFQGAGIAVSTGIIFGW